MEELAEKDLIKKAASGDLPAFDMLIKAHEASLRAFFRVRLFDWAMADDLAQDVFVTAFKRIATFRSESSFGVWLRGIAMNHLRNYFRKRKDVPAGTGEELQQLITEKIDLQYDEHFSGREAVREEQVLLDALTSCLAKLDEPARDLLHQRYMRERTVRDIAKTTARGYSALTMQLHRIRKSLADCIRRQLQQDP